jgi:hypothetical protein
MNVNINNSNTLIEINKLDLLIERFDIKNGLLGIKRDRFLLLLGCKLYIFFFFFFY